MSHAATHWAMQIDAPTPAAKLVLLILADAHNGHTGECFPSLARIVKATGYSESSVKYAVRDLEQAGLLSRQSMADESGRTKGVKYTLNITSGRGQNVTPGGQETKGEGSECDPPRGQNVTPHIDNREKEPGKEPGRARATRLPPGWSAPSEFIDFAIAEGFTRDDIVRRIEPTFRDHWLAASGASSRKADWFATWRNWVRRDAQRRPGAGSRQAHAAGNQRSDGSTLGAYQRAAARFQPEDDVSQRRAGLFGDGNGELEMRYGIPAE